ncbi:MAG: lamin tail domain-containing protein, partial [Draconibacterium sp.]|nr:lamin tail domain-containing protein [Draconibacterium sp.]
ASETGSGANEENKYLKVFYKTDNNPETEFDVNGINMGNWGTVYSEQDSLTGEVLQVIVYMNNHYANDKVILDEIIVNGIAEIVPIEKGDLVINEVLFNPVPEGADYVEIYNLSGKEIPLSQLYLASRNKYLELTQIYPVSISRKMFMPEDYLVLTKDTNGVFPWFTIQCADCFMQMDKFPSFNNDDDYVVLLNEEFEVIDELFYNEKMHSPILADREGVSLERISFFENTNKPENWFSASTESGYGTPGYINSQIENEIYKTPEVTFTPEAFSPNNDGFNDEYKISYQLEKSGYILNARIFDSAGRYIMQLAKNDIAGTDGELIWNGEDESGTRQPLGVYVVVVELFDLNGNVKRFKDGIVLTDVFQ